MLQLLLSLIIGECWLDSVLKLWKRDTPEINSVTEAPLEMGQKLAGLLMFPDPLLLLLSSARASFFLGPRLGGLSAYCIVLILFLNLYGPALALFGLRWVFGSMVMNGIQGIR